MIAILRQPKTHVGSSHFKHRVEHDFLSNIAEDNGKILTGGLRKLYEAGVYLPRVGDLGAWDELQTSPGPPLSSLYSS